VQKREVVDTAFLRRPRSTAVKGAELLTEWVTALWDANGAKHSIKCLGAAQRVHPELGRSPGARGLTTQQ